MLRLSALLLLSICSLSFTLAAAPKNVIIFGLPRTGSTLLVQEMNATGEMGVSGEHLAPGQYAKNCEAWGIDPSDLPRYLSKLREETSTSNGVVGIKVFPSHLEKLVELGAMRNEPDLLLSQLLTFLEGESVVLKLIREDKLRQAISLSKMTQTGEWRSGARKRGRERYSANHIKNQILYIVTEEERVAVNLVGAEVTPLFSLTYEELVAVERREEVLVGIAHALELSNPSKVVLGRDKEKVDLKKQANRETEEWVRKYCWPAENWRLQPIKSL